MLVRMTLHDAMAARVEQGEFPGIVTLIARGEAAGSTVGGPGGVSVDTIGATAFGGDVPMRRETVFRIASLTKPVLAVAALMLAEDDLIDLEEPVARLLPELAGQRVLARLDGPLDETVPLDRPVTIEDLLTFRLGFGTFTEPSMDPPWPIVEGWQQRQLEFGPPDPRTPHDPDEWVRLFGELPLMDQPGTRWRYNGGTLVLGVLLARAAKTSLGTVLAERIFEPLGMGSTGFWLPREQAEQLPSYYMMGKEVTISGAEVWSAAPAFPSGSGGLVSTVDDYFAFARMLMSGGVHGGTRLLRAQSVERMTRNHLTAEQVASAGMLLAGSGWGLGLAVTVEPDEVSGPGRYGWSGGYGTTWFTDPAAGLVGIAMTQVSDFLWSGAITEFNKLAYDGA
jgi:CubicO group peptidase (beta-lactamase class C family)